MLLRKIGGAKSQFMKVVEGTNRSTKGAMTNIGDAVSYVAPSKEAVGSLALGTTDCRNCRWCKWLLQ